MGLTSRSEFVAFDVRCGTGAAFRAVAAEAEDAVAGPVRFIEKRAVPGVHRHLVPLDESVLGIALAVLALARLADQRFETLVARWIREANAAVVLEDLAERLNLDFGS